MFPVVPHKKRFNRPGIPDAWGTFAGDVDKFQLRHNYPKSLMAKKRCLVLITSWKYDVKPILYSHSKVLSLGDHGIRRFCLETDWNNKSLRREGSERMP